MTYVEDKLAQAQAFVGCRVEIPVHYDTWMRGARYGRVTSVGAAGEFVRVLMEHPGIKNRVRVVAADFDYMRIL